MKESYVAAIVHLPYSGYRTCGSAVLGFIFINFNSLPKVSLTTFG